MNVPRPEPLKRSSGSPLFQATWAAAQRIRLHQVYLARREHYARQAAERGLVYRERETADAVRGRLAARGYTPVVRELGEIHTFASIPRVGGNAPLYGDLHELGPVSEFDYTTLGYHLDDLRRVDADAVDRRLRVNEAMFTALRDAHERRPVDWVFVYGNGYEVEAEIIRRITHTLGVPVVTMCLDDKQSWTGPTLGNQRVGQIDIAREFDISWTSARVACEWYLVEGGRPLYMPEGFDATMFRPMPVERDIPVSFVGAGYGYRPAVIRHLRKFGIEVQTFGPGWATGWTWGDDQVRVFNRSVINLGMGGIGHSETLTNVKSRDFEVPGVGGGAYMTSYNPDLAQHFDVGEEILCYSDRDELVELLRYYLARPDEAAEIGRRARVRSLAEHRWLHRYQRVLRMLGVLPEADMPSEAVADAVKGDDVGRATARAPRSGGGG